MTPPPSQASLRDQRKVEKLLEEIAPKEGTSKRSISADHKRNFWSPKLQCGHLGASQSI